MEKVRLGRTDLMVSPAGLGCGGYSRLGMRQGNDAAAAEGVVRHALDLGVNFFDTARAYQTEEVVGRAVADVRDQVVISTKSIVVDGEGNFLPVDQIVASLEKSLIRLQTDYVDVFSFHGVLEEQLDHCLEELVPVMQKQVDAGKIRHLGITESFRQDPMHQMLCRAIPSGCFDVVMVGFNFLNASARQSVFPLAQEHDVATQVMHAVRHRLTNPSLLLETMDELAEQGEIDQNLLSAENTLDFLLAEGESLTEAAYRFCRHEPGVSVVLTGTGKTAHLTENVAAITGVALPEPTLQQLHLLFGQVRSASGD